MTSRMVLVGLLLCGAGDFGTASAAGPEPRRVLRLAPGPGNPRNSEGDFIQLKDGRILFVYTHFTGGEGDHATAYLAARASSDDGQTWSTNSTLVVTNEGRLNVMSVSLLRLRSGAIALFYLRKNSNQDCRPLVRFSRDEARTWTEPVECIADQKCYFVLNNARVVQLAGGRLVVPVAQHTGTDGKRRPGEIACYLSDDDGQTWRRGPDTLSAVAEGAPVDLMEPGVVETRPNEVFMLIRTRLGCQYFSRSQDGAEHWTKPEPGPLWSPEAPATLTRIPGTETLAVIWNDHRDRDLKHRRTLPPLRTPLSVALSDDGGRTWEGTRVLETDPECGYCYTAARWVGDTLLLGYCAHRSRWGLQTTQLTLVPRAWLKP